MKESRNVESFGLDHTKVKTPYVRAAGRKTGVKGEVVTKFDIRFMQPNKEYMNTGGIHTLEHLMAEYIRDELDGVIDMSPMGCRTGFYLVVFGEPTEKFIAEKIRNVLVKVAAWDPAEAVPGVDPVMCGNFLDHDLVEAKRLAAKWVEGIDRKGFSCF